MIPRTPKQVMGEIARDRIAKQTNLLPDILKKTDVEKNRNRKMKMKVFVAVPTFIILLFSAFIYAPAAVEAMGRLLGYVPGFGQVDNSSPLRILSNPVIDSRDGLTVTVKAALLDSNRTVIIYTVENSPEFEKGKPNVCHKMPVIRLANGNQLEGSGNINIWSAYSRQLTYPAIPKDMNDVRLVLPCIEFMPDNSGPKNWEIPLHFITAPPEKTVYPVLDLSTQTPEKIQMTPAQPTELPTQTQAAGTPAPGKDGTQNISAANFKVFFEKFIPLDEGYILYGKLQMDPEKEGFAWMDPARLHLFDSANQEISLEMDTTSDNQPSYENKWIPLAYKTGPIQNPGPLTFVIDSINIDQIEGVETNFVFDPGVEVKAGQTWPFNQEIIVAGHRLAIESVFLDESGKNLNFIFKQDSEIQTAIMVDPSLPKTPGGGGGDGASIHYPDGFPAKPVTISVVGVTYPLTGPWKTSIDLPAKSQAIKPLPQANVCLTKDSWMSAKTWDQEDLAAGLSGKLALSYLTGDPLYYHVMVHNIGGSDPQLLGAGKNPSLSQDGKKVVYKTKSGLEIVDLATMGHSHLPGTKRNDWSPLWSPDGKQIAFTRGPESGLEGAPGLYHIWTMNADGSGLKEITTGNEANLAMAWMPDGKSILFTTEKEDGAMIRKVMLDSGEIQSLFQVNYQNATIALSPDGKRIAFEQMLPGDKYALYVADLDGSNQRLIASPYPLVATIPHWSPDGQWLSTTVHDPDSDNTLPVLGFIQVDTCQIVRLPQMTGYVSTWLEKP